MTRDLLCNNEFCRNEKSMNSGPITPEPAKLLEPVKQTVSSNTSFPGVNTPKQLKRQTKIRKESVKVSKAKRKKPTKKKVKKQSQLKRLKRRRKKS